MRNPQKTELLGRIGEELAPRLLQEAGFTNIENLNELKKNHEDADFLASREGRLYFISVKARNMRTNKGNINKRYKLHNKKRSTEIARQTARSYNAEYAWLAIQLDRFTFSAYFGTHAQLLELGSTSRKLNGNGIMMDEHYTAKYLKLAKNQKHNYEYKLISNQLD